MSTDDAVNRSPRQRKKVRRASTTIPFSSPLMTAVADPILFHDKRKEVKARRTNARSAVRRPDEANQPSEDKMRPEADASY